MERIILNTIIVLIIGVIFIAYYYQLYKGGKLAKMLLIIEIGIRVLGILYVINYGKFYSVWELLYYIPTILSIILFYAQGKVAKILFGIFIIYVISSTVREIYMLF